jgi:hypothetical protein
MTDIQLVQSSKKKHKKDRKDRKRDGRDITTDDLAVTEGEGKSKKRKERKEKREGAVDGARLFLTCFAEG